MAGTTTNISIRMDSDLKAQADALFSELGMNLTTAFNIFVRQSIRELLETVIETLAMGSTLPPENRDHDLTGNWRGHRECHIQPDWLLIYRIEGDVLVLTRSRTGTHSDLFGK